jgi:hypothetical protein
MGTVLRATFSWSPSKSRDLLPVDTLVTESTLDFPRVHQTLPYFHQTNDLP